MKKMLLKLTVPAALVALAVLISFGCSNPAGGDEEDDGASGVAVTGVSLDQTALTLGAGGGTATLTPVITPEDATNRNVSWSSDHEEVATVDGDGVVTGVGAGTAIITVRTQDGGYTANRTVTVTDYAIGLTQTGTLTFTEAIEGYTPANETITVKNTGTAATGTLAVTLTGANDTSFILSASTINDITETNGTDSFTVAPDMGLTAGTYTATVTVSNSGNDISAEFTVSFTVIAAVYDIDLSRTEPLVFPAVAVDYTGTPEAATITVTNTGNLPTGALTVGLTGANDTSFTLSKTAISDIAVNGTDSFTVGPEPALAAGTHTATVTVSGGNGISADFDVSFTVTAYGIGLSQSGTYTFTAALAGYGTQTPVTITVTNSPGNQPTGALTVELTGDNAGSFTPSKTAIDSIAAGQNDTFTVVPNTALAAETYTATVTVSGDHDITGGFDVSFTVKPAYTIKGTITKNIPGGPDGPAAGASVQLKKDGSTSGPAVNAADGSYTISGVEAGDYTIEVSLAGYTTGTTPVFSVAGDVTGKDLRLLKIYGGPAFFVKPLAAGDGSGSSWANASDDIQAMIDISADYPSITEIWVAAGTYTPAHLPPTASTTTDRDRTFLLKAGVKLYGGFAGTETARSERNWTSNPTILSGDFNGDDMGGFTGMGENAYHVVLGANISNNGATVLDGFTIRGGNADTNSSITVGGKAIYRWYGGGMHNNSSSPVLTNVSISGNQAASYGGGMYNYYSSPVLTNVSISGNQAARDGGGMHNSSSSPVLTNVTISGNQVTGSTFSGGGMYNLFSSPVLTNVTISGNQANGMRNNDSSPVLTNVTISGNQADGMRNSTSSSPQIRNSIIWGNGTGVYNDNSTSTPSYTNSLVEGLNPYGSANGGGNLNGNSAGNNPKFVSPEAYTSAPSTAGDYRLQGDSPAINKGNGSFYDPAQTPDLSGITTDLDGNPRFNGAPDMGAYEVQ
jgi:hypothetical protein